MIAFPKIESPARWIPSIAIGLAALLGLAIVLAGDLPLQMQVILAIAAVGLGVWLVVPNRRILLVCAWVLAHPLSLEKIFLLSPKFAGFLPPTVVVSGSDLIFYLLLITMVLEALCTDRRVFYWNSVIVPYAILVSWVLITFVLCGPTTDGVVQVLQWIKTLLFLVTMSSAIKTREELQTVLLAIALAVLAQSAIVGISFITKRTISFSAKNADAALLAFSGGGAETIIRANGTVGHVNQQAMFHTLFTIPLGALCMVKNPLWRLFAAMVLLASFCAIILTFSRASWVSCAIAATIAFFVAWRRNRISRAGWLGLGLACFIALITAAAFSGLIVKRLTKGDDGASSSRINAALLALEHISLHPLLGVGPGNFINAKVERSPIDWAQNVWLARGYYARPRFVDTMELSDVELEGHRYYTSVPAHNKFLLLTAEFGFVGLALFLLFQWRLAGYAWRSLGTDDPFLWWAGLVLFAVFWATQVEFMFELFYNDKTVLIPLFTNAVMINFVRIVAQEEAGRLPA